MPKKNQKLPNDSDKSDRNCLPKFVSTFIEINIIWIGLQYFTYSDFNFCQYFVIISCLYKWKLIVIWSLSGFISYPPSTFIVPSLISVTPDDYFDWTAILTFPWNFFCGTCWSVGLCSFVLIELHSIFDEIVGTVGRNWFGILWHALSVLAFCWGGAFRSDSWIGFKSLEMALRQLWSTMVFIPEDEFTKNVSGKIKR